MNEMMPEEARGNVIALNGSAQVLRPFGISVK